MMIHQQSVIIRIVSDLFDDEVRPEDNFIDLGGNSITALALKESFDKSGIEVSVDEILSEPIGDWGRKNDA
ncbi:hypothetical protein CpMRi49_01530 [Corynebacterium ulcerans]|uniref:phosphopantetheine-binding protein n=1 Tax=Corynebacterium ulcerans TaxID=65058 RepID=UPI001303D4F1|nr:acyl carrier protein [Corynebacterium ulcerans]MBL4943504.1 hypothetical protein [Corynebacterium ulcerans]QGZ24710.1 hypothetical protein CpMRi49_01530 [Corynebacterium ulcerans]QOE23423.1 hypothetical protein HUF05_01835 [Corynebacterium ulcerans]